MGDKKIRVIKYKGYEITQKVEWVNNPMDGDGYEVRTYINKIPKYSGFNQLNWLNKDQQKKRLEDEINKANYQIDLKLKSKEPTIFDELGFKKDR